MKLDFTALTLENFGCFSTSQRWNLARPAGLYFLRGRNLYSPALGSNGAGKTTLSRALAWVLKGRSIAGLHTTDLQPWNGKKGCRVALEFSQDGKPHRLERASNPNRILLDGHEVSQDDLDRRFGLSLETICNTLVFPQGQDLFLDKTPRQKLQLLTDALALDRWEAYATRASEEAGKATGRLDRAEAKKTADEAALGRLEGVLARVTARSAEWERERAGRQADFGKERAELSKKLEAAERLLGQAEAEEDGASTEARSLIKEMVSLQQTLQRKEHSFEAEQELNEKITEELQNWRAELEQEGKVCSACGQSLRGKALEEHRARLRERIHTRERDQAALLKDSKQNVKEIETLKTKVKRATESQAVFTARADKAQSAIKMYLPMVTELKTKLRALAEQEASNKEEGNPFVEEAARLRREISELKTALEQLDDAIADLKRQHEETRFWVKGFRDVCLYILDEVVKEVEFACNAMLPELGLDGWRMVFDIERETASGNLQRGLNIAVISPDNDRAVRWECWCGGESQRLRIVAALALSEVLLAHAGVRANLEILDEPTRHLSTEGTRDLCAFLATRARELGVSTWWVDHAAVESTHFADVVTVVRRKTGSVIEERV